jgi:MSHA biogenesis protein MshE
MMDALRRNDASAFNHAVAQDKSIESLASSALNLAIQGVTSLQEVMRVAADLDDIGLSLAKEH